LAKEDDEELLLMSYIELKQAKMEEVLFLYFGCNNRMTGNKNKRWFIKFDESFSQIEQLGNNTNTVVVGKGNIHMQVNGFTQVIFSVYYVF